MSQQKSILAASGITAFLLTLVAGLMLFGREAAPAQGEVQPIQTEVATPTDAGPSLQALVDERENAYRQQLDEANARLQEANARLQQFYSQTPTPLPPEIATHLPQLKATTTLPRYAVSAGGAARIALGIAPGSKLLRTPDLVSFKGIAAYEVLFQEGNVYIDANTGRVLYSDVQAPIILSGPQPGVQNGGDDERGEGGGD